MCNSLVPMRLLPADAPYVSCQEFSSYHVNRIKFRPGIYFEKALETPDLLDTGWVWINRTPCMTANRQLNPRIDCIQGLRNRLSQWHNSGRALQSARLCLSDPQVTTGWPHRRIHQRLHPAGNIHCSSNRLGSSPLLTTGTSRDTLTCAEAFFAPWQACVYVASDGGRVCRPLIICDQGKPRVNEEHTKKVNSCTDGSLEQRLLSIPVLTAQHATNG